MRFFNFVTSRKIPKHSLQVSCDGKDKVDLFSSTGSDDSHIKLYPKDLILRSSPPSNNFEFVNENSQRKGFYFIISAL